MNQPQSNMKPYAEYFQIDKSTFPVRDDVIAVFRDTWEAIANPGTWWTGEERVAIAAETRAAVDCRLCRERKAALSPYSVEGEHDTAPEFRGILNDTAIDTIHRIMTDQGRISERLVTDFIASGLSHEHYVELVSVIVITISVDDFYRGLGLAPEPLPEPVPGEPSRKNIADERLDCGIAFVPMLKPAAATGDEADLWSADNGLVPNVLRAMSLVPNAVREFLPLAVAMYVPIEKVPVFSFNGGRLLSRPQMELVAARVSATNGCFY